MLRNNKIEIESKKVDIINKKIESLSKVIDSYYKQTFILIAVGGGFFYYSVKFWNNENYIGLLFLIASLFFGFWLSVSFVKISIMRSKILRLLEKVKI